MARHGTTRGVTRLSLRTWPQRSEDEAMHISPRMITLVAFLLFFAWMIWLTITRRKL